MKRVKKKVSKLLLSLTMVIAIALAIMPTNVFANEAETNVGWTYPDAITGEVGAEVTLSFSFTDQNGVNAQEYYIGWDCLAALKAIGLKPTNEASGSMNYKPDENGNFNFSGTLLTANPTIAVELMAFDDRGTTYDFNITYPIENEKKVVTVTDGTSDKSEYAKDETVTITANAPATGKQFKEWVVVSGGVTLANSKSATTTFTMADNAVEVTATYEDIPEKNALVFSPDGGEVTLEQNMKPNNTLDGEYVITLLSKGDAISSSWSVASGSLPTGMTLSGGKTYAILEGIPTVKGTYTFTLSVIDDTSKTDVYTTKEFKIIVGKIENNILTVNGGVSDKSEYAKDETVTITANSPATGKQFKEWIVVSGDVTLTDSKSATTTFIMPDKDVEVTAIYEDIPQKNVLVFSPNGGEITLELNIKPSNNKFNEYIIASLSKGNAVSTKWSVASGSLPTGMTLWGGTTYATLEGTPTVKGTYTFTLSAIDYISKTDVYTTKEFKIIVEEKSITITGGGSVHQISDGKDMTFTCSGKSENLTGVYVDGKLVDESNYTLNSESTIMTLKTSYLDTLSIGKHTLKFQYKNNVSAETDFTITAKEETKKAPVIKDTASPKTGDTTNTMLYIGFIVLSGCVAGLGLKKKKSLSK